MNQFILNQSDLSISLGVDYSNEEFGKNQVRKVELMRDEDQVGVSLVSSYPAGYSLEEMETALKKLESEHLKVKLLSNIDQYISLKIHI